MVERVIGAGKPQDDKEIRDTVSTIGAGELIFVPQFKILLLARYVQECPVRPCRLRALEEFEPEGVIDAKHQTVSLDLISSIVL